MYEYRAKVLRWVDGDTVDVEIDLGLKIRVEQRIRLAGINTPETNSRDQAQKTRGIQAVMVAARLAPPSLCVTIRTQKPSPDDKYGRWMAEVINSEGKSINQELLIQGLAKPWDGTGPAPV